MRLSAFFALALLLCACSRSTEEVREVPAKAPSPAPPTAPAAPDSRHVLAVFGDSIAAGFGVETGLGFPEFLQKKLDAEKYPWRVVNLGISGDTTEGGVSRIDSAVSLKPEIVILELGGNDGLRGLPPETTRKNLETMIVAFQKSGARVVLAGMTLPPNYGAPYIQQFEKMYRDLAATYKLTLIPFLLQDLVTKDLRYMQSDGLHPTAAGHQIVADTVFRTVKPFLSAAR
ncbi:MAG TPA: arylesterase [Bryobacteraceae bacterium]|jgi:acyl-CoA thioesterase-1|nr:arylesterase [Bryobacteraceae bacterium]